MKSGCNCSRRNQAGSSAATWIRTTRPFRASIVARARFIEDLVVEQAARGVSQYVILGAGLDSFVQRRPEMASRVTVFEVDPPAPQAWKQRRLVELGFGVPDWLRFVPVDFEAKQSWRAALVGAGFDAGKPAVVVSTGVSMYLTHEANAAALREVASLAPPDARDDVPVAAGACGSGRAPGLEMAAKGARASGTPFISFFMPAQIQALAREAGFAEAAHVSAAELTRRYFADRTDGLRPPNNAEELLAATV